MFRVMVSYVPGALGDAIDVTDYQERIGALRAAGSYIAHLGEPYASIKVERLVQIALKGKLVWFPADTLLEVNHSE